MKLLEVDRTLLKEDQIDVVVADVVVADDVVDCSDKCCC